MRTPHNLRFAVPVFTLAAILVWFGASAAAQSFGSHGGGIASRGVPASVTSFGFGGHPGFHGVPASVTSQGFGAPGFRGFAGGFNSREFNRRNDIHQERFAHRRHRRYGYYSPFYGGYYGYVPAYPYYMSDEDEYSDQPADDVRATRDYADRRELNDDYRAEITPPREQQPQASTEPVPAQPNTVLIFKDGHQLEVANYAIVGSTLYDLSDGRSKKVQLADLDLQATVKENDDRGIEFQIPAQSQLN